jgi:hypothetical protein
MHGSFRDTPEIIFGMGRVKTIDKFIARSFEIFHCATSVLPTPHDARTATIRALRAGPFIGTLRPLCGNNNSNGKNNSKTPCQN